MKFQTIVADPPWKYGSTGAHLQDRTGGRNVDGRGANVSSEHRYGSMSINELKDLNVTSVTADNAHLYLWTTNSFMVEAHELACSWGFCPKTIITWVKIKKQTKNNTDLEPSRKSGYYYRGATEHIIFCVRGSLKLQTSRALPTALLTERLPHSVKPDEFYDMVDEASPGPVLELFARRARQGWAAWGEQAPGHIDVFAAASNPFLTDT